MHQLAKDEHHRFPDGASVLLQDVYMDDILSGADTKDEALKKQDQLIKLCKAGGFSLKKWAANSPELLETIAEEDRMQTTSRVWSSQESTHSTLGLL